MDDHSVQKMCSINFKSKSKSSGVGHYVGVRIKHMGVADMLLEAHRVKLANEYVARGVFNRVLAAWVSSGSGSGRVTKEATRRKVGKELAYLIKTQIALQAIRMTASWNAEYRNRDDDECRANLDTDVHLTDVLNECLDCMAEVVEAGVKTRDAWGYVETNVQQEDNGVLVVDRSSFNTIVTHAAKVFPRQGPNSI